MPINKSNKSEKEVELINKVAKKIVDSEMETPALWLLQTIKPLTFIGGELSYFYLAPFLPFLDDLGYTFLDTFEKRKNIERLIKTVEHLQKEQSRENKKIKQPSMLSKLMKKFYILAPPQKKAVN
jgi:hypothetical protein